MKKLLLMFILCLICKWTQRRLRYSESWGGVIFRLTVRLKILRYLIKFRYGILRFGIKRRDEVIGSNNHKIMSKYKTSRTMKLLDVRSGLMECSICGNRHFANIKPGSGGRFYRGTWQCLKGCKINK